MRSIILAVLVLFAPGVAAQTTPDTPDSTLNIDPAMHLDTPTKPFGQAGSRYWGVFGRAGNSMEADDSATDLIATFNYHYFLLDDFEIIGELGAWYSNQAGDNAAGLNPGFTLRWHFLNKQTWTLYSDVGIGMLFSTDTIPDTGTSFNFTPHVGGGATFRLNKEGLRGYVGTQWHHVSNGQIQGGDRNPDRNGVAIYAGVMFPF